jgi:gas vesicle protein
MFSRVRIAIRFFFVGLAVGVLLAPRSGEETRRLLREKADALLNDVLDAATLGTSTGTRTSSATTTAETAEATEASTGSTRGGNGSRTRSRSTAASEAGV